MSRLGVYGTPEMIHIHHEPQVKYPTEVLAAASILNPQGPRLIPAPQRPKEIFCPGCCKMKKPDQYHHSRNRPTGRHPYCKACRKAGIEKSGRKRRALDQHWYRS